MSALANSLLRAAMVKLAAIRARFFLHPERTGSVSSKSLTSNSRSVRRGEQTEVRQVSVAADLDFKTGTGGCF